jgi:hypothetical protein
MLGWFCGAAFAAASNVSGLHGPGPSAAPLKDFPKFKPVVMAGALSYAPVGVAAVRSAAGASGAVMLSEAGISPS